MLENCLHKVGNLCVHKFIDHLVELWIRKLGVEANLTEIALRLVLILKALINVVLESQLSGVVPGFSCITYKCHFRERDRAALLRAGMGLLPLLFIF